MYLRKRRGKGFTYQDKNGETIKDEEIREWIKSLIIPPAWTDVEIEKQIYWLLAVNHYSRLASFLLNSENLKQNH